MLNREPTVAVAAGHKAIGDRGDGDTGSQSNAGVLDMIIVVKQVVSTVLWTAPARRRLDYRVSPVSLIQSSKEQSLQNRVLTKNAGGVCER